MHLNSLYLLHLHFEQMLVIVEMFPFDGEIIHILDQRLAGQSRAISRRPALHRLDLHGARVYHSHCSAVKD